MPKKILEKFPEGHEKAGQLTGVITFKFEDDTTQSIDCNALSDAVKFNRMIHGISQTVGDSYAGAKAEENPLAYSKQVAKETIEQLLRGEIRATRESGPRVTDLAQALFRVTVAQWEKDANGNLVPDAEGKVPTLDDAVTFVGTLDEAKTKEFRKKPKIAAAIAAIAAEKAAKRAADLAAKAAEADKAA